MNQTKSLRPSALQVVAISIGHMIVASFFWGMTTSLSLNFGADPTTSQRVIKFIGTIGVYPIEALFYPMLEDWVPEPLSRLMISAVLNSLLWGVVLALLFNLVRARKAKTHTSTSGMA